MDDPLLSLQTGVQLTIKITSYIFLLRYEGACFVCVCVCVCVCVWKRERERRNHKLCSWHLNHLLSNLILTHIIYMLLQETSAGNQKRLTIVVCEFLSTIRRNMPTFQFLHLQRLRTHKGPVAILVFLRHVVLFLNVSPLRGMCPIVL